MVRKLPASGNDAVLGVGVEGSKLPNCRIPQHALSEVTFLMQSIAHQHSQPHLPSLFDKLTASEVVKSLKLWFLLSWVLLTLLKL